MGRAVLLAVRTRVSNRTTLYHFPYPPFALTSDCCHASLASLSSSQVAEAAKVGAVGEVSVAGGPEGARRARPAGSSSVRAATRSEGCHRRDGCSASWSTSAC